MSTLREIVDELRAGIPVAAAWHELPAAHYVDPARLEAERAALFRALPLVAAHASELPAGATLARDVGGVPLILIRDALGTARAFKNACRHRASRLCDDEPACARKALVCRYHGWTYDLAGALLHVPHEEAFAGLDRATRGLVEVPLAERHGLLWTNATNTIDVDAFLGELDLPDLGDHVVFRRATSERRCNWKLVIDAFLEGYHIRHLHRGSIYRFFLDAHGKAESVGPHVRAVSARRAIDSPGDVRDVSTPSYVVFPNTVVILHPDYTSVISVTPLAVDRTRFEHALLVPRARTERDEHFAKSFELIEHGVFQGEDLAACEAVQRGLAAGADDHLIAGGLELALPWFHAAIEGFISRRNVP